MNTAPPCGFPPPACVGAPTATVLPEIDTPVPKESPLITPVPRSFVVSEPSAQPDAGLTNTSASPVIELWSGLPPTIVLPAMSAYLPKLSLAAPSDAHSAAFWVSLSQPEAGLVNTKTAPCAVFEPTARPLAPAIIVLPEIATSSPR